MRPQLYCDIDCTLNDHWKRIRRNSKDGAILPSAFTRDEVMKDEPLPHAVSVLQHFANDWDVRYLSSRAWDWPNAETTKMWLAENGFPNPTKVSLVDSHEAKAKFLDSYLNWCDLHIDDFSFGQERGGEPPFSLNANLIKAMPRPYEILNPGDPEAWLKIKDKYYKPIPNGELFWQLMVRNLRWWRSSKDFEAVSRARYYDNFASAVGLTQEHLNGKIVAEVGAGPFGGMIRHLNPQSDTEVYIDILANAQRVLRFIEWPENASFADCEVENIYQLESKSVDVLLSYNAIDHGYSVRSGLDEIARVSKEFFVAFDCKADTHPLEDRVDHYQIVEFQKVCGHVSDMAKHGKIQIIEMGDLRQKTPNFYFEHNYGFPVFYCHAKVL